MSALQRLLSMLGEASRAVLGPTPASDDRQVWRTVFLPDGYRLCYGEPFFEAFPHVRECLSVKASVIKQCTFS